MSLLSADRGQWTVFFDDDCVPCGFEHRYLGDEGGSGGLWFDGDEELTDWDGVFMLPQDVIDLCETCFFFMHIAKDDEFDDEPDFDDVWADSDALASAGWGTDEDYGG